MTGAQLPKIGGPSIEDLADALYRLPGIENASDTIEVLADNLHALLNSRPLVWTNVNPEIDTAAEWDDWHAEQARSANQSVSHEVKLPDSGNEHRYCVPHDHEWVEITTIGAEQRHFICAFRPSQARGCPAEKFEEHPKPPTRCPACGQNVYAD